MAIFKGLDGGLLDVGRGWKVRLADFKVYDIDPCALELLRLSQGQGPAGDPPQQELRRNLQVDDALEQGPQPGVQEVETLQHQGGLTGDLQPPLPAVLEFEIEDDVLAPGVRLEQSLGPV